MRTFRSLIVGGVAGLLAGLLLTAMQALARLLLGVPPLPELISDRIAPLLSIEQLTYLFTVLYTYNAIKQAGILGALAGQLVVAVLLGVAYGLAARRGGSGRGPKVRLAVLTALAWMLVMAALWPTLGTNHLGLSPLPATATTMVFAALSFALFVITVIWMHRLMSPAPVSAPGPGDTAGGADPGAVASPSRRHTQSGGRRALLVGGVGVGLVAAVGGLGHQLYRRSTFEYDGRMLAEPMSPVTPTDKFYIVTKNLVDPDVSAGLWSFAVAGAVRQERSWSLEQLRAMPPVTQETTLMCINNPVGGGLESNAMWTGVPLATLIEQAGGPGPEVIEVALTGVDGYVDTFAIEKAMDPTTLLALDMNGQPLPRRHGFPARIVVPGLFGEKNLKWVTKVELVTEDRKGFYETQGWGPTFVIPTRSRITSPVAGARVPVGRPSMLTGTAFGGNRGVSRVEISLDGGRSWTDARITYPGTRLSWALWRHDWVPGAAGEVNLTVRATDGAGGVQAAEQVGTVLDGATGYHRVPVTLA